MPTPIAHSFIGVLTYLICLKKDIEQAATKKWRNIFISLLFCLLYANILDMDFLPGIIIGDLNKYHHGFTHSLGFCLFLSFLTAGIAKIFFSKSFIKICLLSCILLIGHLLMDYFTGDTSYPYGVMFFWPFSNEYLISPISLFPAFPKRGGIMDLFNPVNIKAYTYEIVVLLPVLVVAIGLKWKHLRSVGGTKK